MDWKYLFTSFEGRISRKTYWTGILVLAVIGFIAGLLDVILGTAGKTDMVSSPFSRRLR